jgi:hypothetical protein
MLFTSKSARTFYDSNINTTMPDDATEISAELHAELMAGQTGGKVIEWNKKGVPFLKDAPLPTAEELNAAAQANRDAAYRAEADPLFFQYQRDEIEKQVWLDKIVEIKTRFPKV